MSSIYVEIFEPNIGLTHKTLFWEYISPTSRENILIYLLCLNRLKCINNQDIIKMILYAVSDIQVIYSPEKFLSQETQSYFIYSQEWLKSKVLQKYNPLICCSYCCKLPSNILLLVILESIGVHKPKFLDLSKLETPLKKICYQACEIKPIYFKDNNSQIRGIDYIFGIVIDDLILSTIKSIKVSINDFFTKSPKHDEIIETDATFYLDLTKFIEIKCIEQSGNDLACIANKNGIIHDYTYKTVKMYNFSNIGVIPNSMYGPNSISIEFNENYKENYIDGIYYLDVAIDPKCRQADFLHLAHQFIEKYI